MRLQVSLAVAGLFAAAQAAQAGAPAAAETCYQDSSGRITQRRLPGSREVPCPAPDAPRGLPQQGGPRPTNPDGSVNTEAVAPPRDPPARISPIPRPGLQDYVQSTPVPDRWRIVDALGYRNNIFDPYNRNVLKADKPVHGDWFFNASLISDSVYEQRDVVTPVGGSSTGNAGQVDIFGSDNQWIASQTLAAELVYYEGDTVFKPPEWEFRFTPVFNYNYTELDEILGVNVDPREGRTRRDYHLGIQAAFVDRHLRNVSDRYDFDSLRVGIQPFSSDFRGFLFQDNQLGIRLFGTRANNRFQYNLAYFRRLEKDTNSGLNDVAVKPREDDVVVANVYMQDMPVPGFTSQATVLYNRNREDSEAYYDKNGFIQRPSSFGREVPRAYDVTYVGYNGDGHFGRFNLTASVYGAFGKDKPGIFVNRDVDIRALFAAAELSVDFNWLRVRLSALYGSGDKDPYDDKSTGFDAVLENPQFAGADTSYWIRQAVPLVGGGRVALSGRNGVLNSLRGSKDEGQSNFVNPGVLLGGLGADADITPTLRLSLNLNTLYFDETAPVEIARNQGPVDKHIGYDLSAAVTWRPLMSQNIVVRGSYATLLTGDGLDALFPEQDPAYLLVNVILAF